MSKASEAKQIRDLLYDNVIVACPKCGYIGDIQHFDVLGSEGSELFCNDCGEWVEVEGIEFLIYCPTCGAGRHEVCKTKKGNWKQTCPARETNAIVLYRVKLLELVKPTNQG